MKDQPIGEGATTLDMLYANYPWLKDRMESMDRKLDVAQQALEYISQPTIGFSGDVDIQTFVRDFSNPEQIKDALLNCICIAQSAKENIK
tara:strand:- start:1296 stop:1565 length:270 start_codon:yes stop_codon:yes gene_type:complete